jgi:HEPN domain-containing protein
MTPGADMRKGIRLSGRHWIKASYFMNEVVKEWIEKAEADFATAEREFTVVTASNFDAVCFHAQQCIEKYMKAFLILTGVVPPRTHDLPSLSRLLQTLCPSWNWPVQDLRLLSRAAVSFRYPGETADHEEAQAAMNCCRRLRSHLAQMIGAIESSS